MARVAYFRHSNRKSEWAVAYQYEEWPERSLRARGWTQDRLVFVRDTTPEEDDWLAGRHRLYGGRAASLEGLLEDEERILRDRPATLEKLKAALTSRLRREPGFKQGEDGWGSNPDAGDDEGGQPALFQLTRIR